MNFWGESHEEGGHISSQNPKTKLQGFFFFCNKKDFLSYLIVKFSTELNNT